MPNSFAPLHRAFTSRHSFQAIPAEGYSLLPFQFLPLDGRRYVLTNLAGQFLVVPHEVLHQLVSKRLTAQTIAAHEAKNHVGETATVCGKVASTRFASSSRGQPTFLNLDMPYPQQIFTVLIWGSDRPKFGRPEVTYRDRRICVTGEIRAFRGVPEVVAHDPGQVKIESGGRK